MSSAIFVSGVVCTRSPFDAEHRTMQRVLVRVHLPSTVLHTKWYEKPLWQSWATRLDWSHTFYVLPGEYRILAEATGYRPPHFKWSCGDIRLVILGNADPACVSDNIYWTDSLPQQNILSEWAKTLHAERLDAKKAEKWDHVYAEAFKYHVKFRDLVRKIGKVLDVDRDCHNLTRTRLVLFAMGYLFFWQGSHDQTTKELAKRIFKEYHTNKEDHNNGYPGERDILNIIADRLTAHLLLEFENDGQRGWKIPENWLTSADMKSQYESIKKEFGHINLYDLRYLPRPPLPQLWYRENK